MFGIRLENAMASEEDNTDRCLWVEWLIDETMYSDGRVEYQWMEYYGYFFGGSEDYSKKVSPNSEDLETIDKGIRDKLVSCRDMGIILVRGRKAIQNQIKIVDMWGYKRHQFKHTMEYLKQLKGLGYWVEVGTI